MDEKLQDLVDMMLVERFGLAELAMKEESDDARAVVQEFLLLDSKYDAQFQKYLYMQGAKDCVAILRELGIIR